MIFATKTEEVIRRMILKDLFVQCEARSGKE